MIIKIHAITPKTNQQLQKVAFRKNTSVSALLRSYIRKELSKELPGENIE